MEKLADKNPKDNAGYTPLHTAAKNGRLETCKLICRNIEDKNPYDDFGRTPLSYAHTRGNLEIVSFLENLGNEQWCIIM